ncbi:MAG: RsmB/NOP family class I SAM-dependent RNA methyltransferase [Candidatus Thorarchaeota archaeon]
MASKDARSVDWQQIKNGTLEVLNNYETGRKSVKSILRSYRSEIQLGDAIHAKIEYYSIGVIRFLNTIDFYLSKAMKYSDQQQLSSTKRNLLRMAVYQFCWANTPISEIAEHLLKDDNQSLKILKNISLENIETAVARLPVEESLSIRLSHPSFLVRALLENLGEKDTIKLLNANNKESSSYIRPNNLISSVGVIDEINEIEGVSLEEDQDVQGLYRIQAGLDRIVKSKAFSSNRVLIQDKASVLAVKVLDPNPGEFVWDACGAPGMKTQLIWEIMNRNGKVVATDTNRTRFLAAKKRALALGASEVEWRLQDASHAPVENAQKILIDAPCTSTGKLQSHPSYKWRLNKKTLFSMMTIQNKILEGILSAYSKSSGTEIVYATCSLLPHEGESQIDSVLQKYPIELLGIHQVNSPGYPGFTCSGKICRMFPHTHQSNGFFISKFRVVP